MIIIHFTNDVIAVTDSIRTETVERSSPINNEKNKFENYQLEIEMFIHNETGSFRFNSTRLNDLLCVFIKNIYDLVCVTGWSPHFDCGSYDQMVWSHQTERNGWNGKGPFDSPVSFCFARHWLYQFHHTRKSLMHLPIEMKKKMIIKKIVAAMEFAIQFQIFIQFVVVVFTQLTVEQRTISIDRFI